MVRGGREYRGKSDESEKLSIMINNFIKYLKGSRYKGSKYKNKTV
jgi:hypothetical protein